MPDLITFPPGVVDEAPVRLPILARGEGWFAVDKPAGLLLAADALHPDDAPSITGAIHAAARAGKPQLAALGIHGCSRIHALDAEISGVAVLASSEDVVAALRNDIGTGCWEFVFDLVTEHTDGPGELTCDLPIVRAVSRPRMVVSHHGGKRCRTAFTRVQRLGRHDLWTAVTSENRLHQVRLHAAEAGLRVVGESLYARVPAVRLSTLKRGYRAGREAERPLHPGLAMHLRLVRSRAGASCPVAVEARPPKSLAALVRRLTELG